MADLCSYGQYALLCAIEEKSLSWALVPAVAAMLTNSAQELLEYRWMTDADELQVRPLTGTAKSDSTGGGLA